MRYWSIAVCIIALLVLAALCISVWAGAHALSLAGYHRFLDGVIVIAWGYSALTIFRMVQKVAIHRTLPDKFIPEMIGYLMFWVLVPPTWFFFEYYAFDSGWVVLAEDHQAKIKILERIANYDDFASKIWAAVVAILVIFVSLKKDAKPNGSGD